MGCCCSKEEEETLSGGGRWVDPLAEDAPAAPAPRQPAREKSEERERFEIREGLKPSEVWPEAPVIAEESLMSLTDSSEILRELGVIEDVLMGYGLSEGDEAEEEEKQEMERQVGSNKKAWNSLVRRARKLQSQGELEEALALFQEALALAPKHRKLRARCKKLAATIEGKDKPEETPVTFVGLLKKARRAEKRGDLAKALELFQRAATLKPEHAKLKRRIAVVQKKLTSSS